MTTGSRSAPTSQPWSSTFTTRLVARCGRLVLGLRVLDGPRRGRWRRTGGDDDVGEQLERQRLGDRGGQHARSGAQDDVGDRRRGEREHLVGGRRASTGGPEPEQLAQPSPIKFFLCVAVSSLDSRAWRSW